MPECMALGEVLVSPRQEPRITPLKIFSYMASGRPIVATDLPTHTQVLDARSAILVPPTEDGLADGIAHALDDPDAAGALAREARRVVEVVVRSLMRTPELRMSVSCCTRRRSPRMAMT